MNIEAIAIEQITLSPSVAEVRLLVRVDSLSAEAQLRGALTGPRCPGRETIQIAYPIRATLEGGADIKVLQGRIVIPEPNLWTEQTPYVYEGDVEVWRAGEMQDSRPIRAAFRAAAG